jgi:hypothetical protein
MLRHVLELRREKKERKKVAASFLVLNDVSQQKSLAPKAEIILNTFCHLLQACNSLLLLNKL